MTGILDLALPFLRLGSTAFGRPSRTSRWWKRPFSRPAAQCSCSVSGCDRSGWWSRREPSEWSCGPCHRVTCMIRSPVRSSIA